MRAAGWWWVHNALQGIALPHFWSWQECKVHTDQHPCVFYPLDTTIHRDAEFLIEGREVVNGETDQTIVVVST